VDLPAAQPDYVKEQIENVLAIPANDALLISAKSGLGVAEVLEAIVHRIPAPKGNALDPLQALIFDSWFDPYRGAVVLVRVKAGRIANHMKIRLCANPEVYEVEQLGALTPSRLRSMNSKPAMLASSSRTSNVSPMLAWATPSSKLAAPHRRFPALKLPSPWSSPASSPFSPTNTNPCEMPLANFS
jgi:translation elongation factor EF-G